MEAPVFMSRLEEKSQYCIDEELVYSNQSGSKYRIYMYANIHSLINSYNSHG